MSQGGREETKAQFKRTPERRGPTLTSQEKGNTDRGGRLVLTDAWKYGGNSLSKNHLLGAGQRGR